MGYPSVSSKALLALQNKKVNQLPEQLVINVTPMGFRQKEKSTHHIVLRHPILPQSGSVDYT